MNTVIIKTDGTPTSAMSEAVVQNYLTNVLNDKSKLANLKQALNDVTGLKGKPSGIHKFGNFPVLHASSGNGQQSVTIFFYRDNNVNYIFAMGEHVNSSSYKITIYGQPTGTFMKNRTISL